MTGALIDSSVLIDCLRGRPNAVTFLAAHAAAARPSMHLIVAAELLAGARNKRELALIDEFLSGFTLAVPTETDGVAAFTLYRDYRLSHGVDWPDCQIAATALRLGVGVYTLNVKHFKAFPGLTVEQAY